MKKLLLSISITAISLLSLMVVGCSTSDEKKTAMEWAKMAVEEEHYQLDDDGYLLTHTAVIQTPSLELVEEAEGKTYKNYLYGKDADGYYYMAFFKHSFFVEKYGGEIEEYVYISAIAWEDRNGIDHSFNNAFGIKPKEIGIYEWQIQDLDIAKVEW